MAQRWPAPNVKPKLSQEEFDEAVRTNIEDFDMTPDEAVKSAVDEFNLQGYDLTCVVRTAAGGDLAKHPVSLSTQAITDAGGEQPALDDALRQLSEQLYAAEAATAAAGAPATAKDSTPLQELTAVAIKSSSLAAVLDSLRKQHEAHAAAADLKAGLILARRLMAISLDIRDTFDDIRGPELVLQLSETYAQDLEFQAELAATAECACFREEQNKDQLMERGYGVFLLRLLQQHTASSSGEGVSTDVPDSLVLSACGVLRALCTADDDRPPSSKAFMNARVLARQHGALSVVLTLLRAKLAACQGGVPEGSQVDALAAVLAAVRSLAANEEICKDFSDAGGVTAILTCIRTLEGKSRDAVRCALGALRQLSHSDGTKHLLSEAIHAGEEDVVEPVLGVVANMTLRQPEIVERCVSSGVIEWIVEVMGAMPTSSLVQRQACILLRNMVVRNTELRSVFLSKGVEPLVRAAKKAHPRNCTDVGSAALRDLGLDDYGTTMVKN